MGHRKGAPSRKREPKESRPYSDHGYGYSGDYQQNPWDEHYPAVFATPCQSVESRLEPTYLESAGYEQDSTYCGSDLQHVEATPHSKVKKKSKHSSKESKSAPSVHQSGLDFGHAGYHPHFEQHTDGYATSSTLSDKLADPYSYGQGTLSTEPGEVKADGQTYTAHLDSYLEPTYYDGEPTMDYADQDKTERNGPERHYDVLVFLVTWQGHGISALESNVGRLEQVFRDYDYQFEHYEIPRTKPGPHLSEALATLKHRLSPRSLLIFYYYGHGRLEGKKLVFYRSNEATEPSIPWPSIRDTLVPYKYNTLFILECCHAGGANIGPLGHRFTKLVLAACGARTTVSSRIYDSFAAALCEILEERKTRKRPTTVRELTGLVSEYLYRRGTPIMGFPKLIGKDGDDIILSPGLGSW